MKKLIKCFVLTLFAATLHAQPKVYRQSIVHSTISMIAPEEDEPQGREGRGFRNMMDGETKMITYTKNELSKMVIKSDFMNSSVYRDDSKNTSTTIMEMMGQKMGFYSDDKEVAKMRDSTMKGKRDNHDLSNADIEISITNETLKKAGYNCKKAYLITKRAFGRQDTAIVWFTPEIKLELHTAGLSGGGMGLMQGIENAMKKMDKIDGFVTGYEMKMNRGRTMKMEVTKIDLLTAISDKDLMIPTGIDIKPINEMKNMFGGMFKRAEN